MKLFLVVSFFTLTSMLFASTDWKMVASTVSGCENKLEVLAKEGESFVYVIDGEKKVKLDSVDGSAFSEESGKMLSFTNKNSSSLLPDSKKYFFGQPSVVDGNPPRLEVLQDSQSTKCRMKLR